MEPVSSKWEKHMNLGLLKDDLSKIFVSFDVKGLGGTRETALSISYTRWRETERLRLNFERIFLPSLSQISRRLTSNWCPAITQVRLESFHLSDQLSNCQTNMTRSFSPGCLNISKVSLLHPWGINCGFCRDSVVTFLRKGTIKVLWMVCYWHEPCSPECHVWCWPLPEGEMGARDF